MSGVPSRVTCCQKASVFVSPEAICRRSASMRTLVYWLRHNDGSNRSTFAVSCARALVTLSRIAGIKNCRFVHGDNSNRSLTALHHTSDTGKYDPLRIGS